MVNKKPSKSLEKKIGNKKRRSIIDMDWEEIDRACLNPKIKYYDPLTGQYIPRTVDEAIKIYKKEHS